MGRGLERDWRTVRVRKDLGQMRFWSIGEIEHLIFIQLDQC